MTTFDYHPSSQPLWVESIPNRVSPTINLQPPKCSEKWFQDFMEDIYSISWPSWETSSHSPITELSEVGMLSQNHGPGSWHPWHPSRSQGTMRRIHLLCLQRVQFTPVSDFPWSLQGVITRQNHRQKPKVGSKAIPPIEVTWVSSCQEWKMTHIRFGT